MAYTRRPFNPLSPYVNQVVVEFNQANDNFDTLAKAFQNDDPTTFIVKRALQSDTASFAQNADTVDGYHVSTTPAPHVIVPLDANGVLDLSATYVRSNVYTFRRVDLTNATSDYMLQVGEEAYISFSNTTSVPLRIATHNGTYYEFHLVCTNVSGEAASRIFMYPNNTTYSNAFVYAEMYRNSGGHYSSYVTFSAFMIGWGQSHTQCTIVNWTTFKSVIGMFNFYGGPAIQTFATNWRDTTTIWNSLGTIVFPQTSSGYIIVRRLV